MFEVIEDPNQEHLTIFSKDSKDLFYSQPIPLIETELVLLLAHGVERFNKNFSLI